MSNNDDAKRAARALAAGDPLAALKLVGRREDPECLALRGIALAQIGDLALARSLLDRAADAFVDHPVERARCVAAAAEVALAARDLTFPLETLSAAIGTLAAGGDSVNAAYADLVLIRANVLLGRIDDAHERLSTIHYDIAPATLVAVRHLLAAEVAIRRIEANAAADALERAARAATVPSLQTEIADTTKLLDKPAARLLDAGDERTVTLREVETLFASNTPIVDACRPSLRIGGEIVSFLRRGTLFTLLLELARAGPAGVARETLFERVFESKIADDTQRARLRVDTSRLRKMIAPHATIEATGEGFRLLPEVVVLRPPIDGDHAAVLALLADGRRWSTAALTAALGTSRRTVQRALAALEADGRVAAYGRGRNQRWQRPPLTTIATALLLPNLGPIH